MSASNRGCKPLPIREYRTDEARFDAAIEDWTLREAGVIEPDQPTEYSDYVWRKQWNERNFGEFTAEERGAIRMALGLGTFGEE
jgi:hypothetical protein